MNLVALHSLSIFYPAFFYTFIDKRNEIKSVYVQYKKWYHSWPQSDNKRQLNSLRNYTTEYFEFLSTCVGVDSK